MYSQVRQTFCDDEHCSGDDGLQCVQLYDTLPMRLRTGQVGDVFAASGCECKKTQPIQSRDKREVQIFVFDAPTVSPMAVNVLDHTATPAYKAKKMNSVIKIYKACFGMLYIAHLASLHFVLLLCQVCLTADLAPTT